MRRSAICCALVFGAATVGLANPANAVPTLKVGLKLKDVAGNPLPTTPQGFYQITPGQQFQVVLLADLVDPIYTDDQRNASLNHRPLGLAALATNIMTPGTSGAIVPAEGPPANPGFPPTWGGYEDLTPDQFGFWPINVVDLDGDGDRDVGSTGFVNFSFSLPVNASETVMSRFQYGLDASIPGIADPATAGPMEIVSGLYQHVSGDLIEITTAHTVAALYYDPPDLTPSQLQGQGGAVDEAQLFVTENQSVRIQVVPEPASDFAAVAGALGLVTLARRSRRMTRCVKSLPHLRSLTSATSGIPRSLAELGMTGNELRSGVTPPLQV